MTGEKFAPATGAETGEITATNGGELFGFMCSGALSPAAVPIQGVWIVVIQGGTGRFENTTRSLNVNNLNYLRRRKRTSHRK